MTEKKRVPLGVQRREKNIDGKELRVLFVI
jgi:hypothetical protein